MKQEQKEKFVEKSIILTDRQLKLFVDADIKIKQLMREELRLQQEQDKYMTLIFEFAGVEKYLRPTLDIAKKTLFYKILSNSQEKNKS